jgi:hypothetical protein
MGINGDLERLGYELCGDSKKHSFPVSINLSQNLFVNVIYFKTDTKQVVGGNLTDNFSYPLNKHDL